MICHMNSMFCVKWFMSCFFFFVMFLVHSCSSFVPRLSPHVNESEQGGAALATFFNAYNYACLLKISRVYFCLALGNVILLCSS